MDNPEPAKPNKVVEAMRWILSVGALLIVLIFIVAALQKPYSWGWWLFAAVGALFVVLTNPYLVEKLEIDRRIKWRNTIAALLVIPAFGAILLAVDQEDEHNFFIKNGISMSEYNLAVDRYNATSDADDHRGSNAANRQTYKDLCDKKVGLACFKYAVLLAEDGNHKDAMNLNASLCRMDFDTTDDDGPMALDKEGTALACYNAGVNAAKTGKRADAIKYARVVCESHTSDETLIPACGELGGQLSTDGDMDEAKEAITHLRRACDAKDLTACYNLSLQYATGHGVDYDKNYAIELASRVCNKQGDTKSAESGLTQKGCDVVDLIRKSVGQCDQTSEGMNCRY